MNLTDSDALHDLDPHSDDQSRACGPAIALAGALRQLRMFLSELSDTQFTASPRGVAASSVGGHVRRGVDHVAALIDGLETGTVDYERRERRAEIERNRTAAIARIDELILAVGAISGHELDRPVHVAVQLAADGPLHESVSTVGRELVFLFSQMVHHNMLIAIAADTLGIAIPDRFGCAAGTPTQLDGAACAPSQSSV
jgi:hypothetical protein